jgi:hypothetical protein
MDDDILKVRDMAALAQRLGESVQAGLSSHEAVCAERYLNIKDRLQGIPRLFEILEKNRDTIAEAQDANKKEINDNIASLQKLVYIGMGICVSVPVIVELLHYVKP